MVRILMLRLFVKKNSLKELRVRSGWFFVFIFLMTIFVSMILMAGRPKFKVKEVLADGTLELQDTRKIVMSGIKMPAYGDAKYEAGMYLLSEMTKGVEVWPEKQTDGYKVWIGCKGVLWSKDCKKGILVNEALVNAGVATKRW